VTELQSAKPSKSGTARVAILGAASREGVAIRDVLTERRIPGSRVDLFGDDGEEAQIGEYAGEARLIQPPIFEEIREFDVVFVCEAGPVVDKLVADPTRNGVVIDVTGTIPPSSQALLVDLDLGSEEAPTGSVLIAPHPLTLILAKLLAPIQRLVDLDDVVATVLRPVADFGEKGIDELREQTVLLLNFSEVPTEVLGQQLAFNVVPAGRLSCETADETDVIRGQVQHLVRWDRPRLSLSLIAVPVFYGHALQISLKPSSAIDVDVLRAAMAAADISLPEGDAAAQTPLDIIGEERLQVARIDVEDTGRISLWAIAGEAQKRAASHAVRLAGAVKPL